MRPFVGQLAGVPRKDRLADPGVTVPCLIMAGTLPGNILDTDRGLSANSPGTGSVGYESFMWIERKRVSVIVPTLRIATWNLDRPTRNHRKKSQARIDQLKEVAADIWILTETDQSIAVEGHSRFATMPPSDKGYSASEAYAAIHSRFAMRAVPDTRFDPQFAVCVEIPESPLGPLIVYGSIITYRNDGVTEGQARVWERHRQAAAGQAADWAELRRRYPSHTLVVAGDFNQALDGKGAYCDRESTKTLWDGFASAELRCLTATDFVLEEKTATRHSIDHIAISEPALRDHEWIISAWQGTDRSGVKLSDHNGVAVSLRRAGRWRNQDGSEVILMTGVEGGGYTLRGERLPTGWRYWGDFVDQTPLMLDENEIRRENLSTESLDEALRLLGKKWHRLPAIRVHPEFTGRIWKQFQQRVGPDANKPGAASGRVVQRWREECGLD